MKKILLAGFEPFANNLTNPTADWINWMHDRKQNYSDKKIQAIILPVTFSTAMEKFTELYDAFCPDYVILTGLASNRLFLTVERIGINWIDARIPDNDNFQPLAQKIFNDGPDGLFTTIPLEKIINLMSNEFITVKVSTSAGEYVCNDLLYKVLCYTQHKKSQTTFIHLPGVAAHDDYAGIYLALENLVKGL